MTLLTKPTILDPTKRFLMQCVCGKQHFKVIVDPSGVTCVCVGCDRRYKLESVGGVKVNDA